MSFPSSSSSIPLGSAAAGSGAPSTAAVPKLPKFVDLGHGRILDISEIGVNTAHSVKQQKGDALTASILRRFDAMDMHVGMRLSALTAIAINLRTTRQDIDEVRLAAFVARDGNPGILIERHEAEAYMTSLETRHAILAAHDLTSPSTATRRRKNNAASAVKVRAATENEESD